MLLRSLRRKALIYTETVLSMRVAYHQMCLSCGLISQKSKNKNDLLRSRRDTQIQGITCKITNLKLHTMLIKVFFLQLKVFNKCVAHANGTYSAIS